MKKNVLVFPCGSEIALEIYRSVVNSTFFNLIGASSCDDHGKFIFPTYIDKVPFISDDNFIPCIKRIVKDYKIDAIFPAMDAVIEILKRNEKVIGCKVVAPQLETTQICLSKLKTYQVLNNKVKTPKIYKNVNEITEYPVFTKPDVGYGSRGAKKCSNRMEVETQIELYPTSIISEYLQNEEYTVDCFTNFKGELLCVLPRIRARIMNGISVNTKPVNDNGEFIDFAKKINSEINFSGAWFFQVKRNCQNELVLMEVAARFGGSSSLFRALGINFALMSLFNIFDIPVSILKNNYQIEMDRALDNKYKIKLEYNEVFIDFDDCLYLDKKNVNTSLITFLFKCRNEGKKITLLSKHDDDSLGNLEDLLANLRIKQIFDRIIHINQNDSKYKYVDNQNSIFIDDSFTERREIKEHCDINVFSLDMVDALL